MWLYRQVRIIILILFIEIVSSKYFILDENVEWTKARQRCSVPSARADDITNYSENTVAWTSSSIYTSCLAEFYGCMDVNIDLTAPDNNVTMKLNSYFLESTRAFKTKNVLECAFHCTSNGNYFAFIEYICKCIDVKVFKLSPQKTTSCLNGTSDVRHNKDAVFSKSHRGLPIFRFKRKTGII
ncbi:unnamed protein product [Mytilus coruscus]|uniref:Uncharacterized protein n=1 Tax=Mytilus coruscus TaxID=42192 RepID=A0A6J8BYU8_MYTCO|nr:unnamed protein product [Mytilus coruscus]